MDQFMLGFKDYGLLGLMSGAVVAMLFVLLKWVLGIIDRLIERSEQQQKSFHALQLQWVEALNRHTEQERAFHEMVQRAQEYQREEHREMIRLINALPSYK